LLCRERVTGGGVGVRRSGVGGSAGGTFPFLCDVLLTFPIAQVDYIRQIHECFECGRLALSRDFVFDAVRKALVITSGESRIIPTSLVLVLIEITVVEKSFAGVGQSEVFNLLSGISDGIPGTETFAEFGLVLRVVEQPRRVERSSELRLEPSEGRSSEECESPADLALVVRKLGGSE
jgi:hypothetical protein